MRLKELNNELGYSKLTSIQREEKCKLLIGIEIEIHGKISDVKDTSISLFHETNYEASDYHDIDHISYTIKYNQEKFGKELMTFSVWDKVKIEAKIKEASGTYPTRFEFELLSIRSL